MADRVTEVLRYVESQNECVTATDVANTLNGIDGDTAGKYLRRLAGDGYITKFSRGKFLAVGKRVSEVSETPITAGQPTKKFGQAPVRIVRNTEPSHQEAPQILSEALPVLTQTDTSDRTDTPPLTDTTDTDR